MTAGPAVIAVIGMGQMGAGVAGRLVRGGARVLSALEGRSADSQRRARAAGVQAAGDAEVAAAAYLLSVVPPAAALNTARHWAGVFARQERRAVYVDCNAVSVDTARAIEAVVTGSGARFVDGCIIGAPGAPAGPGPAVYLGGEQTQDVEVLAAHGLRARSTGGPAGAASALKMAYAGFNKGLTGLAAAMVLAATRAGAAEALRAELAESQPGLLAHVGHTLPDMYAKAWRWDFEMRQVAEFAAADADVARLYEAMGAFFGRLGEDWAGPRTAAAAIDAFLGRGGP